MSLEEKYGALGTVIGREISHAFDTNGAQYDEFTETYGIKEGDGMYVATDDRIAFR